MSRGLVYWVAAIAVMIGSGCDGARATAVLERADISIALLADGSIDVRETLLVRAADASRFERVIRKQHSDNLFDLSATIDGKPAGEGRGAGHIRVESGRPTRIRFELPPAAPAAHTLTLQYRVAGVVAISGNRGRLEWEALPPRRRFDIDVARVELALPDRTVQYGPAGILEPGWTVAETARGVAAERRSPPRDQPATIVAEISTTTLAMTEPRWQFNEARGRELMPAFLSGGIFILVIGAGILWIVRFQYPRARPAADVAADAPLTPSPVLRTLLAGSATRDGNDAPMAAFIDLGRRGFLTLREDADGRVSALPGSSRHPAMSHEQVLLDELWLHQSQAMSVRALRGAVGRKRRVFARAAADDLVSAGLADRDRMIVRSGLRFGGVAVVALSVLCFVIVSIFLGRYGPWPMAMPASILVVGVALLIFAETFSVLTPEGARQSRNARAEIKAMRRVRAGRGDETGAGFAGGLALATAAGFGGRWHTAHANAVDDRAFGWVAPAAGQTRVALLKKLVSRTG